MKFKIGDKVKAKSYDKLIELNNEGDTDNHFINFFKIIANKKLTIVDIEDYREKWGEKYRQLYFKETHCIIENINIDLPDLEECYLYENEVEKGVNINLEITKKDMEI